MRGLTHWSTGPRSWLTLPGRLARVVLAQRSAWPVPRTYLLAALAGVALGVPLNLVIGWPWWAVALGLLFGVWLVFLSTAFWGSRPGGRRGLITELLMQVSPERAARRRERLDELVWGNPPFALYGLPPFWEGGRWTAGIESSGREISSLELGHGDPRDEAAPELRVAVRRWQEDETPDLHRLASDLWHQTQPPPFGASEPEVVRWMHQDRQRERNRPPPMWEGIDIRVNGRPVSFAHLAEDRFWVARARVDELSIELHARNHPAEMVSLVRIVDVEPYRAGWRALRDRRPSEHRPDGPAGPGP